MTAVKINAYRAVAQKNIGHRSAAMILELCDEVERMHGLWGIALDAAYKQGRGRAIAINKLKRLANGE